MSVKSVLGVVSGFLAHHVNDLNAVTGALSGVLQALPVNAETRDHIATLIAQVSTSATNIEAALEAGINAADGGGDLPPVEIKRSDIDAAVADFFASHASDLDGSISAAVAAYMVAHPVTAPAGDAPASGEA